MFQVSGYASSIECDLFDLHYSIIPVFLSFAPYTSLFSPIIHLPSVLPVLHLPPHQFELNPRCYHDDHKQYPRHCGSVSHAQLLPCCLIDMVDENIGTSCWPSRRHDVDGSKHLKRTDK